MMHDLPRLPSCDGRTSTLAPLLISRFYFAVLYCPKESASQMYQIFLCLAQSETVFAALELLIIIVALLHWYGPHLSPHLVRPSPTPQAILSGEYLKVSSSISFI